MLYELAVVSDLPLPSSSHAAVIRSIKQNRRQMPKPATKSTGEAESALAAGQRVLRPAPAPGSAGTSSQKTAPRSLDSYRTDPVSPWHEYDLTPSVFSQPQVASSAPEGLPPSDPALDSVFTAPARQTANGANGQANKDAATTRIDASTLSVNADFGMLFTPRRENPNPNPNRVPLPTPLVVVGTSGLTPTLGLPRPREVAIAAVGAAENKRG